MRASIVVGVVLRRVGRHDRHPDISPIVAKARKTLMCTG
jgi:hypothetical protein